jgi:hypothetical protein
LLSGSKAHILVHCIIDIQQQSLFGLPLKRSGIPSHLGNVSPPSQSWIN